MLDKFVPKILRKIFATTWTVVLVGMILGLMLDDGFFSSTPATTNGALKRTETFRKCAISRHWFKVAFNGLWQIII